MRCRWYVLVLLLAFLTARSAWASASAEQQAIQAAYDKACEAVGLKYLDGIRSMRAPDYAVFSPDGRTLHTNGEADNYEAVLGPAVYVHEHVDILGFKLNDSTHAVCRVHDVLETVTDPVAQRKQKLTVDSVSLDFWLLTPEGWKIAGTRIVRRKVGRETLSS